MNAELTANQSKVLNAIRALTSERYGIPPSVRDVQARLQFRSPNGVVYHLTQLSNKGAIIWERGVARGIVLAEQDRRGKLLARIAELDLETLERIVAKECQ